LRHQHINYKKNNKYKEGLHYQNKSDFYDFPFLFCSIVTHDTWKTRPHELTGIDAKFKMVENGLKTPYFIHKQYN
jgi:hypothetical protein